MGVSANTLFHFTKSGSLEKILLSQGLYPQYSDEHFEGIFPSESIFDFCYIPMISFCDLTIMQLTGDAKHRENFGEYGIGLTKKWGMQKRVTPVTYVHQKSKSTNQLHKLFNELKKFPDDKKISTGITKIKRELVDSIKYFKPHEGIWHKGNKIDDVTKPLNYYNEREWRYCPALNSYQVLSAERSYNEKKKSSFNEELKKQFVKFEYDDVKFIIIKERKEKNHFVDVVGKMKLNDKQKNELITHIISFEEIREDFG